MASLSDCGVMQGALISGGLVLGMVVGCSSTPPPQPSAPPLWAAPAAAPTPAPAPGPDATPVEVETEQPVATATASEPPPSQPAESVALPLGVTRPAVTVHELVDRGLAAIRSGSTDEYMALFITSELARRQCPEVSQAPAERIQQAYDFTSKSIAECGRLIDWSKAREVERVVPTAEKSAPNVCNGHLHELKDSLVTFEVQGQRFSVKLDDPVRIGNIYLFADNPRCRRVSTP